MKKRFFVAALVLLFALALFPSLALADGAYEQLKNDIASAPADGTETLVTLSGDIANFETADILTIEAGQNIVLDMNGHSITVASDFEGRLSTIMVRWLSRTAPLSAQNTQVVPA